MIKRAIAINIALIFCGIKAASAQSIEQRLHQVTEEWTEQTGIYVPGAVRQEYIRGISAQIASIIPPPAILPLPQQQQQNPVWTTPGTYGPQGGTQQADILAGHPTQPLGPNNAATFREHAISQLATVQTVGLWLQRFPTIRVIVQPTPPREFLLTINGEPCPATEKAIYRVPAGAVTVRVWRQGSSTYEKTYNAVAGQVYDVQCAF
ncbi:hypothetical protein GWE18_33470 [Bradyrhizobium sp. CSA112]|uniref:hypothetical protein n=1 Tax=Bradyrhizobium sp. CSA112 TaxID=2699170 RepID=UPI0023AFEF27|nr:hypothetical protein [Bradyrhizobium sp. CSA112]MDE5457639.1 hypothetical protein [Bradyrhizobium sp. CSA112]